MNIRKIIQRRIQRQGKGISAAGDVNAVISANVAGGGSSSPAAASTRPTSEKRAEEATRMKRPERRETKVEAEPAPGQDVLDAAEAREPVTPPIDEDMAGSVNAALHEADE
jgi:hypothetical protein